MRDIHRLAWELHPAALDDLGLEAVLLRYTAEWSENNRVPVDFHSDGVETDRLPLQLETTLYRITQEALTNVTRHANAKRESPLLQLPIADDLAVNGIVLGFNPCEVGAWSGANDEMPVGR